MIELVYHKTSILTDALQEVRLLNQGMRQELDVKKNELRMMSEELSKKNQEIDSLQKEVESIKISGAIRLDKQEEDLKVKAKINHLITEVDKCIHLLSN